MGERSTSPVHRKRAYLARIWKTADDERPQDLQLELAGSRSIVQNSRLEEIWAVHQRFHVAFVITRILERIENDRGLVLNARKKIDFRTVGACQKCISTGNLLYERDQFRVLRGGFSRDSNPASA